MQVKKKFIDKKNATTYNLVFRSTEVTLAVRTLDRLGTCLAAACLCLQPAVQQALLLHSWPPRLSDADPTT